jgi:hypothetical protein
MYPKHCIGLRKKLQENLSRYLIHEIGFFDPLKDGLFTVCWLNPIKVTVNPPLQKISSWICLKASIQPEMAPFRNGYE